MLHRIRRQILPAPPSKPSAKKIIQDSNNNQMESKKVAKGLHFQWRPANKPNKKRSQIHSKTMETLPTYERQFQGQRVPRRECNKSFKTFIYKNTIQSITQKFEFLSNARIL